MKKISMLLVLVLVLLLASCSCALAAKSVDLSTIRDNPDLFEIEVDVEENVAFIDSVLTTSARSYTHKYESAVRYNSTEFDILVVDYTKSSAYSLLRLWITYCADNNYMNITSVSFDISGKRYTFSDVADSGRYTHDEDGYMEKLLIKFDEENIDFLVALEQALPDDFNADSDFTIPMTLHGRENIQVELGVGFFVDFLAMRSGALSTNTLEFLDKVYGTPMKVTTIK